MNVKKLSFFLSSFLAAVGNLAFILASNEKALAYVLAYNLGSLSVGLVTHLAIPLLLIRMKFTRVATVYSIFLIFCSIATLLLFGLFVSAVTTILMLVLAFEYFAVRTDQIISVILFRTVNLVTGFLPLILTDDISILLRLSCLSVFIIPLSYRIFKFNLIPRGTVDLSGRDYVYVMFVNIIWVYAFPLLLLEDASSEEVKIIYLATTVLPLIFFKIQDTLMKIDVFSSSGRAVSSATVIQMSGTILCITYIGLGFTFTYFEIVSLFQTILFIAGSIISALLNVFLMKRILDIRTGRELR